MSSPPSHGPDTVLHSIIEHVFMPPKLPHEDPGEDIKQKTNVALCNNLIEAAQKFLQSLPASESPLWIRMIKTLELVRLAATAPFNVADLQRVLSYMTIGGTSVLVPRFAFVSFTFHQMYLPCISVHKMPLSLCGGRPLPTSFGLRCSKSHHQMPM
jgi:hypothetical protein